MHFSSSFLLASALAIASASSLGPYRRSNTTRGTGFPIPASAGTVTLTETKSITGVFDGGMKTYGRGVSCTGQKEGGNSDAVFMVCRFHKKSRP